MEEEVLTLKQASTLLNSTKQAIYTAIWKKTLKAKKVENSNRWVLKISDLEKYKQNRWSTSKKKRKGKLVFNKKMGTYSVEQAAEILGVKGQHLRYLNRKGGFKFRKNGPHIVVKISEIERLRKSMLRTKKKTKEK